MRRLFLASQTASTQSRKTSGFSLPDAGAARIGGKRVNLSKLNAPPKKAPTSEPDVKAKVHDPWSREARVELAKRRATTMFEFIPHTSRLLRLARLHGMPVAVYVGLLGEVLVTAYVAACYIYTTGDVVSVANFAGAGRLVDLDYYMSKSCTVDGLDVTVRMGINYLVGSAACVKCTPQLVAFCKRTMPFFAALLAPLAKLVQKRRTVAPAPPATASEPAVAMLPGVARKP